MKGPFQDKWMALAARWEAGELPVDAAIEEIQQLIRDSSGRPDVPYGADAFAQAIYDRLKETGKIRDAPPTGCPCSKCQGGPLKHHGGKDDY